MKPPSVIDVGTDTFETQVLQQSRSTPVVVDFWAPWCGPCQTLGPILEALADEAQGDWILAKINIDDHQPLAQRYGVRGIPAVKAFVDGQMVDEFTGVLPRPQIARWLDGFLPSEADDLVQRAQQAEDQGDLDEAEVTYRQALDHDDKHPSALLGLAHIALERQDLDAAHQWLDQVPPGDEGRDHPRYQRLWFALQAHDLAPIDELQSQLDNNPADLQAYLDLGKARAAQERYDEALEALIQIVIRDRDFQDDIGRKTMLRIFALLDKDQRRHWQKRLGQAMY